MCCRSVLGMMDLIERDWHADAPFTVDDGLCCFEVLT